MSQSDREWDTTRISQTGHVVPAALVTIRLFCRAAGECRGYHGWWASLEEYGMRRNRQGIRLLEAATCRC